MGRPSQIDIKETAESLQELYRKEKDRRIRARLKCLILIQDKKFSSQRQLANYLGVDYATVKRWLKQYREEGLQSLVVLHSGGKRRSVINAELHQILERKVNDSSDPFLGYWDAVLWVKKVHGIDLKYNTLRTYLIRHFKTKLKSPRKSHYKKDDKAIEAFLKTPQ
jgi:transposase